ncbi:SDR family oxidoreductase [Mycobacterium sp. CVI_P3]|uniref:SDR family oxidoreductase n=1 Tax=Mycobacterium pinniadriaticum TaxID=2994102 RepID=A0ABT3SGB4_9MYCO|nr:SDR family oxidoreductase [Mycobacterium pinniadriaticum]MCX2931741.1 SDR family oxidoreductase [Mycobacterium pinniadriaticum]MCX2938184.1 SDR family oxidoreductase [Mycobacterium pinniadriaticum]
MGLLAGKVAIVTGAGRGIGRGEALALAREGAAVVVNDVGSASDGDGADTRPAQQVVDEIVAGGGLAVANFDSVDDFDLSANLIRQAVEEFGRLDILVNNAGILRDKMIYNLAPEDFDAVVSVHLRGHFCTTRHACAYWRDEHKAGRPVAGRIVNTSSASGVFGMVGQTSYAAAKAGIAAMTQVTSMEMARYGVTVNAVCPTARTRLTESGGRMGQTEAPTGWHLMHPDNVGPFVAFLACDAASDITGQVFGVFGGVVQRYNGWAPAEVLQRPDAGPWDVAELLARKGELFATAGTSFASPMAQVAALIDRAEAALEGNETTAPSDAPVRVRA